MTRHAPVVSPALPPRERLIVALDVATSSEAWDVVRELNGTVGAFKIGLQLFTAAGPSFVRELTGSGVNVFLDLKFFDIPNTVALAAAEAARLGVWMLNVHAQGGSEMMRRTRESVVEVCDREGLRRPLLLGVTVLTSSDQSVLNDVGVERAVDEQVVALAKLTANAGFDGIVASAREAEMIRRSQVLADLIIVTPGIRATPATNDDQKRVMTFSEAINAGADYVVAGRPIIESKDRSAALEILLAS